MNATDAASFVDKWRARWPEWQVAAAFVPESQRATAVAWFALLQELGDAAWRGADPTPGLAKLAWWREELRGWSRGARRHPLGICLQRQTAPWETLGRTLNALPATRELGAAATLEALTGLASAAAACETALLGGEANADLAAAQADALARCLVGERVLLAGQGSEALWLRRHWPRTPRAPRARRIQAALLHARLRALESETPTRPLPAWRVLPLAWRAARGGR
ncbi:phytoene/squalene synthase family protein [Luteimonas sp. R10]|uniref:phytoene/squalene synthase family protein n=1 Tax=Luteimonas sp. R10 TaxID=3108176 RepID=UPI0030884BDB|nr:phytoene/squalene synthase family protein [Luteimonas sp. R10]